MKYRIIIFFILLLSLSNAHNTDTENLITEYEQKAFYHQYMTKEYEIALGYHLKSCELGSGIGCANVAVMYWNGDKEHKQNKEKTFEYNLKGCKLNNAYACSAIAISYSEGWLAKPDYEKALPYCHKAYKLGATKACETLGLANPDL